MTAFKHVQDGHIPVPNVQWRTPDDEQRNCPKHVEFLNKNKFGKISASVGFIKKKKKYCLPKISVFEGLISDCDFKQRYELKL
jgi:hypothetical protein